MCSAVRPGLGEFLSILLGSLGNMCDILTRYLSLSCEEVRLFPVALCCVCGAASVQPLDGAAPKYGILKIRLELFSGKEKWTSERHQ